MKTPLLVLAAAIATMSFSSCSFGGGGSGASWRKNSFSSHDLTRSYAHAELPRSLWEKLEALVQGGKADGEDALPTTFSPLKIYLIEKNRGILETGHAEIKFGPGGGELDLKDFVSPRNGSFYMVAEFLPDVAKLTRHVFFVSNSVIRKAGGEQLGTGCNTYFDLTSAFDRALNGEGFLLNTTDGRHVSALAGTYFFAAFVEGQLHLASLVIKDSTRKTLHCRL